MRDEIPSHLMSDAEICDALGTGLTVEYSGSLRPMDVVELRRFMSGYNDLGMFAREVKEALHLYTEALENLSVAQTRLKAALAGDNDKGNSSRVLFSNALPDLGDSALMTNSMSKSLACMTENNYEVRNTIIDQVLPSIDSVISMSELREEKMHYKMMIEENGLFEKALLSNLKVRKPHAASMDRNSKIVQHRLKCETHHFDLVRQLNKVDANKKLELTKAVCKLFEALNGRNQSDQSTLSAEYEKLHIKEKINVSIPEAEKRITKHEALWDHVRGRLRGELLGEKPPPGAPSNALSPSYAKAIRHTGMYLWSLSLKTEVLGENTRAASEASLRHVRDGVYKQGYLTIMPTSILFGRRVRSWYRLYANKLYVARPGVESCDFDFVLSLKGADIRAVTDSQAPHVFRICTSQDQEDKASTHFEFQADNDDECYQWLTALRRWSSDSGPEKGGRQPTSPGTAMLNNSKWTAFLEKNKTCADCGHDEVKWISLNLGVIVCDDCMRGHQALTWAVSKIKSISMDSFAEWHVDLLHDHLGNDRVNEVYEASVPAGWQKPSPETVMELKANWIAAKYLWHSFVEDPPSDMSSEEQLTGGLREAVIAGSFSDVFWCYAHGASINMDSPSDSPLVAALMGNHEHLVSFLLLNGADWTASTSARCSDALLKMIEDCALMLY